ncbi:hypothetical protein MPH_04188 [Macrophomina phaseolina MS6]|uniref:Uncharacterized protein n=1 Tax=Macrophomina phaseolina (strain MS6) TaxID=1126212 RepID=K2S840_MACPH|nr:hypothetical protein MPH_04188 [Macrophomina phaseolina MS6]
MADRLSPRLPRQGPQMSRPVVQSGGFWEPSRQGWRVYQNLCLLRRRPSRPRSQPLQRTRTIQMSQSNAPARLTRRSATAHTETKTESAEYEEETGTLTVDLTNTDNYDTDSPDLGGDAQYPMIESEYNKLGILELSSPTCASEGTTFKRDDVYKNIKDFCKGNAGKKPGTGAGLEQGFLLGTNKVNVKIAFDSECTPKDESTIPEGQSAADFVLGDLIEDNCVFYFRAILDGW